MKEASPVNLSSDFEPSRTMTEHWEGRTDFSALFQGAPIAGVDLMPAIEKPEKKAEFLRDKLLELERVLLKFKETWGIREREMDRLEDLYRANRDHVIELNSDFSGQIARVRLLEDELECTKFELNQYVQELQLLETSKHEREKRLKAEAEQREAELCEARDASRVRRDELAIKNRGYLHEVSQLKSDLKRLQARYREIQFESEHKIKELQARLSEESEQIQLLEREVEQERDTFHRELFIRYQALEKLKKVVSDQRQSLDDRDSRIDGLLEQVRQMDGLHETASRKLEQDNQSLTQSNSQLREDAALLREKNEKMEGVNFALQEESNALRGELAKVEVSLGESTGKIEFSDAKIDELHGAYNTLSEQYACLTTKLSDQQSHHQTLERAVSEARGLLEAKEEDWRCEHEKWNACFESSRDELLKEVEIRDQSIESGKLRFQTVQHEAEQLKSQVAQMREREQELSADMFHNQSKISHGLNGIRQILIQAKREG